MMIRANVVERSLVYLLSAVTKASLDQAEAQFYSTANMKARLDLIKASVGASEINEYVKVVSNSGRDLKGEICKCLDQLSDVSDRRNSLVHGQYEFDGNKMKARLFKPNTSKPRKDIPVTEGYILEIAAAFNNAGAALSGMARTVLEFRDMASKTAATPSSGQPSN